MIDLTEVAKTFQENKPILVLDDKDRENEADLVFPAQIATSELVNFCITEAKGLLCVAITPERALELELELMIKNQDNNSAFTTKFTVSVDLIGEGCTTGISSSDRAATIKALTQTQTKPKNLARPGHIFPLIADKNGLKGRLGHTEASIDISRQLGYYPAAAIIEVLDISGDSHNIKYAMEMSQKFGIPIIKIQDLI